MNREEFELVQLKTGQHSLRLRSNMEIFHPVIGPEAEARLLHVEQQGLPQRAQEQGELIIWDIGLGAAANAIAAINSLAKSSASIEMHSFDRTLSPLQFVIDHADKLEYALDFRELLQELQLTRSVQIGHQFRWYFHLGDFCQTMDLPDLPAPHSIFYDPYSATRNPEMWTLEHFQRLRRKLPTDRRCLLTNYTRSTAVRSTWLLAGFYVGIGVAIGEKEETSIASNHLQALQRPLPRSWLSQVRASQNANPLRADTCSYGPISPEDFAELESLEQFNLSHSL